ncbi:protein translocase subunit SecDF [Mycoplasma crocodyli]|uniref:Putative preprotein translocase, SecDF subunit n=1 Tax=Mycoplasma crocodyli (strain ATCC 51981 / MP145) TaxID=512564 RepID=D5E575_MYCCM|nr:protein translocase subunit SecDF [Mycoplasma crocodyli]ADE19744.1 putative preprotein translocase, SecDF subunit [Mycoplasma crocodyli MP145]
MKRIRDFFTWKNWKRIVILSITLISSVFAIVFGSVFYVAKNPNRSIEYGGGIEVLVQVKKDNQNADKTLTNKVSESLFERLTGGTGLTGTTVSSEGDGKIRITKSGSLNDLQRREFESKVADKPILTMTDLNINPLFKNGEFNPHGSLDSGNAKEWIPPFADNGAKYMIDHQGKDSVSIDLKDNDAIAEWTKATKFISEKHPGQNVILMWINIEELLTLAKTKFPTEWDASGHNLYNFVHVNNMAVQEVPDPTKENPNNKKRIRNVLKEAEFRAKDYLISEAAVSQPLNTKSVIVSGNFTQTEAKELANDINYGTSKYDLDILSSVYVDSALNTSAFKSAMLAGLIVFSLISIFMIVNYGLLGALSTISIALYIFLTLLMFTVLRGEYSPATIAALIIGIGISVDANIITFERLKKDLYSGSSLKKSFKNSNSLSFSTIIDANITTLIVAFTLFYFGTKDVRGFSISLILSIIFTLIVMLIFTRFTSSLLVNTGWFDKKLWLLGVHKKLIAKDNSNKLYVRFDYVKQAKWFALVSLIIIIASIIVFVSIGLSKSNIWDGIVRNIDFKGGLNITIAGDKEKFVSLSHSDAESIKNYIIQNAAAWKIEDVDSIISLQRVDNDHDNWALIIKSTQDLSDSILSIKKGLNENFNNITITNYVVSTTEAKRLLLNSLLAISIAFVGIVLYTLVRMRWTFSISAIIGLLHDLLVVVAFIILARLQLSSIMIAAILSIVGFSINDTIVTFDRIREIIINNYHRKVLEKATIKKIANTAISETIKRSFYTTATTMTALIILLAFGNATDFSFNIVMLFGMAIGVYSSIFICTRIWVFLENIRQKGIKRRSENKFWEVAKPTEQTFVGVNDFQP